MHSLTAQVTSSLLPFPKVTVEALREDEITLNSVLHGRFTVGRSGLVWLACGPQLEVAHAMTGERLSAYCFSGGAEHPPSVLTARDFSWLKRSGLLVGLEETEGSVLCLYDLGLSRVVKAVVIPGRITAIEPLVSYGGASTLTQHLHQSLRWFFGIAAVATDLGHVLLVDLCLDDLSCSQSELEASDLQVVTKSPGEIPRLREVSTRQGRHLCLQLSGASGVGATAVQFISRTNHLAVGFSDGNLQLWNMKTLKKEYHSQLEGGRVPVHAFTFQEPENDPRNCCYLWAVQSAQNLEGDVVSLRLLQLAFSERKCLASGKILYEGLEYCEERFSQDLTGSAPPLRTQTTNTRLLSCQTIEKFRPHPDRDDSMNEVASPDTSVSIFSWQVKPYGQGTPTTYIGVFDINRWYHAQMPDSLRTGESLLNCPYLAVWSLDRVVQMVSSPALLDVAVHDRSLSRGLPFTCPPPEQYFNPTTYNFDATCLLKSGIVHLTCSGYQKETLSFLKKAAPCSSDVISTSYTRCLMSGLLSSRLADTQASSLSQEEQLDAILSTAVETSSLGLITGCIKQWTAEEQPGSALNLRYILDWAWNKVVQTKEELDGICAPLFDSSSNFTDPQTLQLLQHSQRLLTNLSTIFHCLLSEAQELTQKGLVGLINKNMVSSLISKYAQVVLWFCRTGLLPEGSDDDALQISRPYYSQPAISNYYTIRREELTRLAKGKWCADCLMIDGLIGHCGEHLTNLWKRDEGGTGQYPPPTLHALLDIYLLDNIDEAAKHAIVIYLLLDVMYSFPTKEGASVESFPIAFAIPIGLVKLVQGLWLLDHNDHQSSFELLLHPAASQCQFEWQHERVLHALMCQGQHSVALRYFHAMKPPVSSTSQAKLCLSVLLHNRCIIEAWALIRQHSTRLNMGELLSFLYESCQELNLIKELLKLPLGLGEQECFEKFLQGTGGLHNRELLMVHYLQQANYIPALQLNHSLRINQVNERGAKLKERSNTRNSILDQYGKVLPRVQRKLAMERAKPYQHPPSIHREVSRPQPLSTISKRSANEKVMSRAGFINSVLNKIEEVWLGKGASPQSSPSRSPRAALLQTPKTSAGLSDPFLGTPITMTSKQKSRLMDLVVQPSCQTPLRLPSPPRPPSSMFSPKSFNKAPELSLLQTPQVVKRARALAASVAVFSAFTPQSILRSSQRPTPVATPSASPGRSITPPLRNKESRITFIEEAESCEPEKVVRWTNGMAADSEISLLARSSTPLKATHKTWSSYPAEEEEDAEEEVDRPGAKFASPEGAVPTPEPRSFDTTSASSHKASAQSRPSEGTPAKLILSFDASQTSVRSTDTTLEYFDAPLSNEEDGEDDAVTVNIQPPAEQEQAEESPGPSAEQQPLQETEDAVGEGEEEEEKENQVVEELMEVFVKQGAEDEDMVQREEVKIQDAEFGSTPQGAAAPEQADLFSYSRGDGSEVESHNVAVQPLQQDVQSEPKTGTETAYQPEEEADQSADLTEFVEKRLFADADLSPPLTRSGIHSASRAQTSSDSVSPSEAEVEVEQASAEAPPPLTSQKSTISVTSSEPAGTDSHSVVSLNDSEELSSSVSEDDEDDEEEEESDEDAEKEDEEEDEEEEEEEDSGSEVEIIEEVQGNGRLPPLQPTPVFVHQADTHFLPSLGEQEAAGLSLVPPVAELVEDDLEGDVVMVRLGNDEAVMGADVAMAQGSSSYVELKPSTTLLVPLELMECQDGLVDSSQLALHELHQPEPEPESRSETHGNFSLMLDVDEEADKDADLAPVKNDVLLTDSPARPSAEVLFFGTEGSLAAEEEEQKGVLDLFDGACGEESPVAEVKTNHEDAYEQLDAELAQFREDQEAAALLVSETSRTDEPADEPAAAFVVDEPAAASALDEPAAASALDEPAAASALDEPAAATAIDEPAAASADDEPAAASADDEPAATSADDEPAAASADDEPAAVSADDEPAAVSADDEPAAASADDEPVPAAIVDEPAAATAAAAVVVQESIALLHDTPVDEDEMATADDQAAVAALEMQEEPNEVSNHAVDTEAVNHSIKMETVAWEIQQDGEDEEDKEIKAETTAGGDAEEEEQPKTANVKDELPESDGPKEEESVVEMKIAPPTRRVTRGRTVTFSTDEELNVDGADADTDVGAQARAASPSRTPRKGIVAQASTPRRSARKAQQEPPKVDEEEISSRPSSPARRHRAAPTRSSQVAPATTDSEDADAQPSAPLRNSRTPTAARRRAATGGTPRRSSRKIPNGTETAPPPLDTHLEEDEEQEEEQEEVPEEAPLEEAPLEEAPLEEAPLEEAPPASPSRRRGRKPKAKTPAAPADDDNDVDAAKRARVSSPGRATRQSSRQSAMMAGTETAPDLESSGKPARARTSRTTRSKLWDPPEEDLPLLDSPLEVDSETPVADALIKRLQDEEKEDELVTTKTTRSSSRRRNTKEAKSLQPVEDGGADDTSPTENSYVYSPSRRRTRAKRSESPGPSEESSAPLTRRRRVTQDTTAAPPHEEVTSEEDRDEKAAGVATTRKTSKRTARSRAAPDLPPVAEVELISPLPSPAEPLPRAQKKVKEGEAATATTATTSGRNLRRKRIMDAVFTKPVTRRKKL